MGEKLSDLRRRIRAAGHAAESELLAALLRAANLDAAARAAVSSRAAGWVRGIRAEARPGLIETMLEEYKLSTKEGVALMCLAEALLRVPDAKTTDSLIADKIAAADWGAHLGRSASPLVNASAWALFLTGRALSPDEKLDGALNRALRRLGGPVIRAAAMRAVELMGGQFILGRNIGEALKRAAAKNGKSLYSFDMLGEAAATAEDARRYFESYKNAVQTAGQNRGADINQSAGVSVKLSALHPRYEEFRGCAAAVADRLAELAREAKNAGIGLTIDAEESERLELSLDIIENITARPELKEWDGLGVAVQAYGRRAPFVIDWLGALARQTRRRIAVRLVKGAYWDGEIKRAQTEGLAQFPVFTRKAAADVSYIACARKLLHSNGVLYPQFATHNAHTAAAVLQLADGFREFEFQRLHGMGAALHARIAAETRLPCRIYAPVGAHRDLLAYLARRLLENGANSSFVNQIMDASIPPETIAACPLQKTESFLFSPENPRVAAPKNLFMPGRKNSRGWDLHSRDAAAEIERARAPYQSAQFSAAPLLAADSDSTAAAAQAVINPADESDIVGTARPAVLDDCAVALRAAKIWDAAPAARAAVLCRAADLLEENYGLFFALLAREAGKTVSDAAGEVREAADFLRYYAAAIKTQPPRQAAGIFVCISPWNFPLAIFCGQIGAALAAGNAVLAKPAEQTPLIGYEAVKLLHAAGAPRTALQFLPGAGAIGAALTSAPQIAGAAFTGSTATAKKIQRAIAENPAPGAPFIAETGGINAMLIDSTALPEQAVQDVVQSAFRGAGQRCSALRVLYVQEDIMPGFKKMLFGAMDALAVGAPWNIETDIGPLIDKTAAVRVHDYLRAAAQNGRLLKTAAAPKGLFAPPAVVSAAGIEEVREEIFGPVLHLAPFRAGRISEVIGAINASGYGLTFGLHSRMDSRVAEFSAKLKTGNMYVNRNQIGAVVGSQPFGGEGLSGTGPKAGGARYLPRFQAVAAAQNTAAPQPLTPARRKEIRAAARAAGKTPLPPLRAESLPGPTGELNILSLYPRGIVLCLGPGKRAAKAQAEIARRAGCPAVEAPEGAAEAAALGDFAAVFYWGEGAREVGKILAARRGAVIPFLTGEDGGMLLRERHLCADVAAAGGNAALWISAGAE
ncbi:MAG: bifunctional proline dehydrogenase/L-glutamate gamma-semialdehyde dehydrogenase PutA [Gammaproteobacteria bacterium]